MRARHTLLIVVVLAAWAAVGCKDSDRTIKLPGAELDTFGAINLQPGGIPMAASPDGRYYAIGRPVSEESGVVEIRDFDTQSVKLSWDYNSADGLLPVMFDRNGTHALLVSGGNDRDLFSVDLSNGSRTELPRSPVSLQGIFWGDGNTDRSILSANTSSGSRNEKPIGPQSLEGTSQHGRSSGRSVMPSSGDRASVILTSSGKVFQVAGDVLYDVYGDAWFKEGAGWGKVDKEGRRTTEPTPPKYLVREQSRERGSMRLVSQETELEHMNAHAYLTTIWLENSRGIDGKAALVCTLPDVMAYGFVPGRQAVYAVTKSGSYIVPYTVTEK